MHRPALLSLLLMLLVLVLSPAVPAWADDDDDDEFRINGVILGIHHQGQGRLTVWQQRRNRTGWQSENQVWTVTLHARVRVEERDDDCFDRSGRAALRLLRVGDLVRIEGRRLSNDRLQAREIMIRQRGNFQPAPTGIYHPPVVVQPGNPVVRPLVVINQPADKGEVTGSEFTIAGQTTPGASVRIEVTAIFQVHNLPVPGGTVTADQRGYFSFTVRPSFRMSGMIYRVTVTSTYQGVPSLPASITLKQI